MDLEEYSVIKQRIKTAKTILDSIRMADEQIEKYKTMEKMDWFGADTYVEERINFWKGKLEAARKKFQEL